MKKLATLLIILFSLHQIIAQKIKIIDQNTGQTVPFVNVRALGGKVGLSSDIDGVVLLDEKFSNGLLISHINYQTLRVARPYSSVIRLVPKENTLAEIIVNNFNPAIGIIKKAVANRDLHNPKKLHSFTHYAYSKLSTGLESNDSALRKMKNQYLLMTESRTKHQFLQHNYEQETVLFHRTSGIKNPILASIITDVQPFSFYDELIYLKIDKKNYLNPVSTNSWKKYDFVLSDTILNVTNDTTFVISFSPKSNATFEGFKGILHINTDRFAIENISVEPANKGVALTFKMQQRYERVQNQWFPKQQNTELLLNIPVPNKKSTGPKDMYKNIMVTYTHKTYLSDIQINDSLNRKNFSTLSRIITPKSYQADEGFWNKYRSDSLNEKEQNTYRFYAAIPQKKLDRFEHLIDFMEAAIGGAIPFHKFEIPFNYLLRQNLYEGTRLGFGLRTGSEISKRFSLEGYAGYGFKDKAFKYGFSAQINTNNPNTFLKFSYQQDVTEPAREDFNFGRRTNLYDAGFRNYLTERMDSIHQMKVVLQTPMLRNGLMQIGFTHELRNPAYLYQFAGNEQNIPVESFINTALNVSFRWAWGEKYTRLSRITYQSEPPKAVLFLSFEKGFKDLFNSNLDYEKLNIHLEQRLVHRTLGKTNFQITASKIWGDVPYSYLQNGLGSSNKLGYKSIANTFQTMGLYEFASDQQMSLLMEQNFGRIFSNKKQFSQPELVLSQGVSFGSLAKPQIHQGISIKTLERGYFESGLALNKLLRIKYVKLFFLDFGVGVFARYGTYSLEKTIDNFTARWTFGGSF